MSFTLLEVKKEDPVFTIVLAYLANISTIEIKNSGSWKDAVDQVLIQFTLEHKVLNTSCKCTVSVYVVLVETL